MNFLTRFFLVFSLSGLLSSVGHYRKVTPSLLNHLPQKTSKTNFVYFPVFRTGVQRYALFLILQIFLQNFSNYFFAPVFHQNSSQPVFRIGTAKVRLFYLLPNLFLNGNSPFVRKISSQQCNPLKDRSLSNCYIFVKWI